MTGVLTNFLTRVSHFQVSLYKNGNAAFTKFRSLSATSTASTSSTVFTGGLVRPFAVIKVGGEVLSPPHVSHLIKSLKTLQALELPSLVIHGGGPQLNDKLKERKVEAQYYKGHRITDLSTLDVAKDVFTELNKQFVKTLSDNGIKSKGFPVGVFGAEKANEETGVGYVGEIKKVYVDEVSDCLADNVVPVLTSLGVNLSTIAAADKLSFDVKSYKLNQLLNINADVAAKEVSLALEASKVVYISSKGGWIENNEIISEIDLAKEFDRLVSLDYTGRQGTLLKLLEIKTLLDQLPKGSTVSIVAAEDILSNLVPDTSDKAKPAGSTFFFGKKAERDVNVGLIGARGYTGQEFCRLLMNHPNFKLKIASSRQNEGQNVAEVFQLEVTDDSPGISRDLLFSNIAANEIPEVTERENIDLWVLALPNNLSTKFVEGVDAFNETKDDSSKVKIIDLSADHRFDHAHKWTYGLPERPEQREALKTATKISNPGCYATGIQMGLMPLLLPKDTGSSLNIRLRKDSVPTCFGVSGYSGAGTNPSRNNDTSFLADNLIAYKITDHIHERECSRFLGTKIDFTPHVGQWFQGIHLTLNCYLEPIVNENGEEGYPSKEMVIEYFNDYYAREDLVKVNAAPVPELPTVRNIQNQHHVELCGFEVDSKTGRLVVISFIDNLLKGAATQALQNLNITFDLGEYTGIPRK